MVSHLECEKDRAPVFHSIPQDQTVTEGASLRLTCSFHSQTGCWTTWDRNGIVCVPSHRIVMVESPNTKCLQISGLSLSDSGFYRITVENDYGRVEASIHLKVIENPLSSTVSHNDNDPIRMKRQIMENFRDSDMVVLTGQYRSEIYPSLKVYFDNEVQYEINYDQIMGNKQTIIRIKDNTQLEARIYCCILQSISGKTSATVAKSSGNRNRKILPPKVLEHLPNSVTSFEGCETDLTLRIDNSLPFTYVWLRNGIAIEDCNEFRYIDHGRGVISLRIVDPFVLDSGTYECIIASAGVTCRTQSRVKIMETDCVSKSIPQIMMYPQSYVAEQGSVVIICAHIVPLNCEIKWKVCGIVIEKDSDNVQMKTNSDGLNILYIHNVTYDQCGEIQCMATAPNHTMTTTASSMLTVTPILNDKKKSENFIAVHHPYFLNTLENCRVFAGSTITLEVKFHGYPEPQIIWMRTGRPIEDINASIATKPGCSILTMNGINANQSGKYAAFIINNYGSDITSASVTVEGPPDPPSGKPSVALESQGIIVNWCGPPYDGGCMISGFLLEIQFMDEEWNVLAIVFDSLTYFVKNLLPNKFYKFRIRAKNAYGYSEPGQSSDAVLIPNTENEERTSWKDCEVRQGEEFSSVYESLEELGRGRFGVVHKVRHQLTGDIRAAKIVKCIKATDRKKVQEEIAIMRSLQHPKLLQLIQCFEATREIIMVVEYISGGELFERVVADDFTLTEKDCVMFMRQICEGVCYMHNLSIVHLDLKPENIMCSTRNSHQIKIIDFGLAQQLLQNTSVRVLLGTPEFVPPEIINYEPIGFQSDMWSIGVICYVLLSGLSPFMGETDVDTFNNITRAEYDFDDDAFDIVSEEAKDFISGLLLYRKEERLSATQCLQTKWLSLDSDALGNSKICTHKLKKFIVRRKWQKTGNAIRALGRMASLSASRRNSSSLANTGVKPNTRSTEFTT